MSIQFEEQHWPLVIVRFGETFTDAEFDGYLRRMDEHLARGERLAYVFDATRSGPTPSAQQQRQAEWMKSRRDLVAKHVSGAAFVFTSPFFRFMLSAVFLIQRMACPYIVCGRPDEGVAWAREQLRKLPHDGAGPPASERAASRTRRTG